MKIALLSFCITVLSLFGKPDAYTRYMRELNLEQSQMDRHVGPRDEKLEWIVELFLEAQEGNWDRIEELTAKDRKNIYGTYYHNLAKAMKGTLADGLLDYYQPFELGLFIAVDESSSRFAIECTSDVWFHLGEMTMAEHSAMLGLAFSPNHYSIPAIKRLAEINLINGQTEAASKYLHILADRKESRKWAMQRMPGKQSQQYQDWLEYKRVFTPQGDFIHGTTHYRHMLQNLLLSNPGNRLARQYLLCLDILTKELGYFMEDYDPALDNARVYQEAVLVYLAVTDQITSENIRKYGITEQVIKDFSEYNNIAAQTNGSMSALQSKFGKTYWFFYNYAQRKNR